MKVKLVGIPSNAGGLYTGTELTPKIMRQSGIIKKLEEGGFEVKDFGDLQIPSFLPRHNIAPIRNWPAPRIVWEETLKQSGDWFNGDDFVLILGGDCSIVTGTAMRLHEVYGGNSHIVAIDAHIDAFMPSPEFCVGAAGLGLGFLIESNPFITRLEGFDGGNISIMAYQALIDVNKAVRLYNLDEIRKEGLKSSVNNMLSAIPANRKILVHLDLDVIAKSDLHAVYSPSDYGLSLSEIKQLLSEIIKDQRVVGLEITEFFALYDGDGSQAQRVIDIIVSALRSS